MCFLSVFFRGEGMKMKMEKRKKRTAGVQGFIVMGGMIKRAMLLHRTGKRKRKCTRDLANNAAFFWV